MSALNGLPRHALSLLFVARVVGVVADSGRIDKYLRTSQRHESCGFGIPLIPANQYAQTPHTGIDRLESHVAGREVELLVVARVVGDVHLAILAGNGTVLFEYYRCVMIQACGATFEE